MLNRLYNWYGKRVVWATLFAIGVLTVSAIALSLAGFRDSEENININARGVRLASVAELSAQKTVQLVGDVEAVSKANIQSEVSGRVTDVYVSLGNSVKAGTVIAQLENQSERAAVLQAEGAYEAALAGAATGDVSVREAENTLESTRVSGINTFRSGFNTLDNVVSNLVDELYANPESGIIGFKLEGPSRDLNDRRTELRNILTEWKERTQIITNGVALQYLSDAENGALQVAELLNILARVVVDDDNNDRVIEGNTMETYQTRIASARTSVNALLQNIDSSRTSIQNSEEAFLRAQIGGTTSDVSAVNAQVKQALGALRGAQARLNDTIFRTPISGTVNQLTIKVGDFIGTFQRVATIANNNAFLITTFISEADRDRIAVGDNVTIEGRLSGRVTNIAPAIDPDTKKIEVQIQAEGSGLSNGDTVRLSIEASNGNTTMEEITIPVSALKVETDRISVFSVSDGGILKANEVQVGPLVGENIVIESGISPDMEIVRDARGLNEGDNVSVLK